MLASQVRHHSQHTTVVLPVHLPWQRWDDLLARCA